VETLLLTREELLIGHLQDVRQGRLRHGDHGGAEEAALPAALVLLLARAGAHGALEDREELAPARPERGERARLDQRLEDRLVDGLRVDLGAEVVERVEPLHPLARVEDRLDRLLAAAAD